MENDEVQLAYKKCKYLESLKHQKSNQKSAQYAQYVIEACINAVSDFLNMKNIKVSSMKSFDEKLYICETCHKPISKNEIPCQAVFNKMALDPKPDELTLMRLGFLRVAFPEGAGGQFDPPPHHLHISRRTYLISI